MTELTKEKIKEWKREAEIFIDRSTTDGMVYIAKNDQKILQLCDAYEKQTEIIAEAKKALEFYSKPLDAGKGHPKGTHIEFGCQCCSGIIEEDNGIVDHDRDVCGLTAREALQKIRSSGEEK